MDATYALECTDIEGILPQEISRMSGVYAINVVLPRRPGLQSGQLPAQAMLAEGNQRPGTAQPSSETDQDGGTDCSPCSANYLSIG